MEDIVISANSAPLSKASVDPVGSARRYCGTSVNGSLPPFACHQRVNRCGRAVISDTEPGPTPAGSSDPAPTRRATIRNHATSSPGPAFFGADSASASLEAIGDARCLSVEGGGGHGRLHQFVCRRVRRNLEWTDQGPRDGLSLDRLPATARPAFFPCRQAAAFLAGQKSRLPPSSAMLWA